MWEHYLTEVHKDPELLSFIKYGFPMGYVGPMSNTRDVTNHTSADMYPVQVEQFIQKEITCGAVHGPMDQPPFAEWVHISPIMTGLKADPNRRRVILDLSYPADRSVNSYIKKNMVLGQARSHTLPSVDTLLRDVAELGTGAFLFTLDVKRAYKNFRTCPLDWPLLGFRWKDKYYVDTSMPFGSRASSLHMQRVAEAITAILRGEGIRALMYLDDLVVVAASQEEAWQAYEVARKLFADLGLPEAQDKRQPPAQQVYV